MQVLLCLYIISRSIFEHTVKLETQIESILVVCGDHDLYNPPRDTHETREHSLKLSFSLYIELYIMIGEAKDMIPNRMVLTRNAHL